MNDKNAFDRQLEREIDHLAGPDPQFDVSEVIGKASQPASRWHLPSPFGMVRLAASAAIVAVFGGFLLFSGVLAPTDDPDDALVGASPTASAQPAPTGTPVDALPPVKVAHVTGTFDEVEGGEYDDESDHAETRDMLRDQGFDVHVNGPARFTVTSSDPRLSGDAFELVVESRWQHETTVDDIEKTDSDGPWQLVTQYGRLEIMNENGSWSGTTGPAFWAQGREPVDGVADNAPTFEREGPTVLTGNGDYQGLTAFIDFSSGASPRDGGAFEAIIVNRETPGAPPDRLWLELMQEARMTE